MFKSLKKGHSWRFPEQAQKREAEHAKPSLDSWICGENVCHSQDLVETKYQCKPKNPLVH